MKKIILVLGLIILIQGVIVHKTSTNSVNVNSTIENYLENINYCSETSGCGYLSTANETYFNNTVDNRLSSTIADKPNIDGANVTSGYLPEDRIPENFRVTGSIQGATLNATDKLYVDTTKSLDFLYEVLIPFSSNGSGNTADFYYKFLNSSGETIFYERMYYDRSTNSTLWRNIANDKSGNIFTKIIQNNRAGYPNGYSMGLTTSGFGSIDWSLYPLLSDASGDLGNSVYEWGEVWAVDTSINHDSLWMRDDDNEMMYHIGVDEVDGFYTESISYSDLDDVIEWGNVKEENETHIMLTKKWKLKEGIKLKDVRDSMKLKESKIEKVSLGALKRENDVLKELLIEKGIVKENDLKDKINQKKNKTYSGTSKTKETIVLAKDDIVRVKREKEVIETTTITSTTLYTTTTSLGSVGDTNYSEG